MVMARRTSMPRAPHGPGGSFPGEDADAAGDLPDADGEHGVAIGFVVVDTDHTGYPARRRDLGQPESDTQPAQPAGKALGIVQAVFGTEVGFCICDHRALYGAVGGTR